MILQVMLWNRLKCSIFDGPTISFIETNSTSGAILPLFTLMKILFSDDGSRRYSGEAAAMMR